MRQRKAKKTLEAVKTTYNDIGEEFDRTRSEPVSEFPFYRPYLKPGAHIADIGCGNGRLLKSLQEDKNTRYDYTGIDNSEKMIALATSAHPAEKFIKGDLLDIPLQDGSQDVVFVIRAFHHLPDRKTRMKALFELNRILKPGGILIITVWNLWQNIFTITLLRSILRFIYTFGAYGWNDFSVPWGKNNNRYYHAFTPSELANLITKSRFELEEEFCVRKDKKVQFKQAHDIVVIAKRHPLTLKP